MRLPHPAAGRLTALMRNTFSDKPLDRAAFDKLAEDEWADLFALAAAQGVLAVAYDALKINGLEASIPRETRIKWALSGERIAARYEHQEKTALKLAGVLSRHGIRMMIFKGLALSRYYPRPEHREFGDLDIYLFGDYDKANKIMEAAGIEVDYHDSKNSSFGFDGILIENHHAFTYRKNASDRLLESYFAEHLRNAVAADGYYVPSPEFNVLYLLHHAARHFLLTGFSMRTVIDWGAFLKAESAGFDMAAISNMLSETGLTRFYNIMTAVAGDILGLDFNSLILGEIPAGDKDLLVRQMFVREKIEGLKMSRRLQHARILLQSKPRYKLVPYGFWRDGIFALIKGKLRE